LPLAYDIIALRPQVTMQSLTAYLRLLF
jgi:hypothetical protein